MVFTTSQFLVYIFTMSLLLTGSISRASSTDFPISNTDRQEISHLSYYLEEFGNVISSSGAVANKDGHISDSMMINFGITYTYFIQRKHCIINGSDGKGRVAAHWVLETEKNFFGKVVSNRSAFYARYADGFYYFHLGDAGNDEPGDFKPRKMSLRRDGSYLVLVDFYNNESHQTSSGPRLIVKRVTENGKRHFIVLNFKQK